MGARGWCPTTAALEDLELLAVLGTGSSGLVRVVRDRRSDVTYALKVLGMSSLPLIIPQLCSGYNRVWL